MTLRVTSPTRFEHGLSGQRKYTLHTSSELFSASLVSGCPVGIATLKLFYAYCSPEQVSECAPVVRAKVDKHTEQVKQDSALG